MSLYVDTADTMSSTPGEKTPKSKGRITPAIKEQILQTLTSPTEGTRTRIGSNTSEDHFMHNSMEQHTRLIHQDQRRYSSTSSVYAEHTISDPNNDQVLYCIGAVLQAQMFDDLYNPEFSTTTFPEFNLPISLAPEYGGERDEIPEEIINHETLNDNELRDLLLQKALPTVDTLYRFFKYLMVIAEYSIECNILALVYINRLTVRNKIAVSMSNWRGLWLGAIILAQKVWDDKPLKTSSFCSIIPNLKKDDLISIEMKVFSLLDFSTTVRPSVYAKYFFELHELFKEITGANSKRYKWPIQPLTMAEKKKLELRSYRHGREYRKQSEKKQHPHSQSHYQSTSGGNSSSGSNTSSKYPSGSGCAPCLESSAATTTSSLPSTITSLNGPSSSAKASSHSSSMRIAPQTDTVICCQMKSLTFEDVTFTSSSRYVIN